MLIHVVSPGKKFLEVIVSDVDSDRHANGGPKVGECYFLVIERHIKQ